MQGLTYPQRLNDGDIPFAKEGALSERVPSKAFGRTVLNAANQAALQAIVGGSGTAPQPVTMTWTGTMPANTVLKTATPPISLPTTNSGATAYSPGTTGVWLSGGTYVWPKVTALTFNDLTGIISSETTFSLILASCTSITFTALTTALAAQFTVTAANLTSFTANSLVTVQQWSPAFPLVTSLSLPAFTTAFSVLNFSGMTGLTSFSVSALSYVGGSLTLPGSTGLASISFPAFTYAASISTSGITYTSTLVTIAFGALTDVGDGLASGTLVGLTGTHNSVTTLTLSALSNVTHASGSTGTAIDIRNMGALTSLSLAGLANIIGSTGSSLSLTTGTAALTTLTFGTAGVTKRIDGNIIITSAALNQASVDGILARLKALDGTGGTTLYTGAKTVTITGTSSTPSATGLADKATLAGRGITVTTN